jgi:hypothetical protein
MLVQQLAGIGNFRRRFPRHHKLRRRQYPSPFRQRLLYLANRLLACPFAGIVKLDKVYAPVWPK